MTTQAPSVAGTMNLLTRLSRVTYRSATPELLGVKLKEFVALTYLRESTRATQQKLAKTLMMDANNCVILLNGLEENGLIERERSSADGRVAFLRLSQEGEQRLSRSFTTNETERRTLAEAFAHLEGKVVA